MLGLPEEAIACCEQALRINPRLEKAWNNKGSALLALGKQEAIECYNRALQINPGHELAQENKKLALADLGIEEESIPGNDRKLQSNQRDKKAVYQQQTQIFLRLRSK